jgi:hypothetical protein
MLMQHYNALSSYLRGKFGRRVHKIPLHAGFTCPNRDGVLSHSGCAFCNPKGSGTGLFAEGLSLAAQWERIRPGLERKYKTDLFLAYLQSFSNTYGTLERLQSVLEEIRPLPGLVGLCIGTRPDCLDADKIKALADFAAAVGAEGVWLDMGLQSARDETLKRINRGHDAACFFDAAESAAEQGLKVCAHVIAGLPGEDASAFELTMQAVDRDFLVGIKFHNLYVCENTSLAKAWREGDFLTLTQEAYVSMVVNGIVRLRPDVVVHRLVAEPAAGELLAPDWAARKQETLNMIHAELERCDLHQGMAYKTRSNIPL